MQGSTLITVAYGDGSGPEIMDAMLYVLQKAGAPLAIEAVSIGSRIYNMGSQTGIPPSAWNALNRSRILIKAPIINPDTEGLTDTTKAICERFAIDMESRIIEQCGDISAAGYIGEDFALFEPLQDAEPKLAGKNKAHPAPMLLAGIMVLRHIGQEEMADRIQSALTLALADEGWRTRTTKFAESVVECLKIPA